MTEESVASWNKFSIQTFIDSIAFSLILDDSAVFDAMMQRWQAFAASNASTAARRLCCLAFFEIASQRVPFHSTALFFLTWYAFVCASVLHCVIIRRYFLWQTYKNKWQQTLFVTVKNMLNAPSLALRAASKAILHNEENYRLACDGKEESRTHLAHPCTALLYSSGLLLKGKHGSFRRCQTTS